MYRSSEDPCNISKRSVARKDQTVVNRLTFVVQEPAVPLENTYKSENEKGLTLGGINYEVSIETS